MKGGVLMKNERRATAKEEQVAEILSVIARDDFCGSVACFGNKILLRLPQGDTFCVTVEKK